MSSEIPEIGDIVQFHERVIVEPLTQSVAVVPAIVTGVSLLDRSRVFIDAWVFGTHSMFRAKAAVRGVQPGQWLPISKTESE